MSNWKEPNKYHELCNFKKEVKNIFLTKYYNLQESRKVPLIMNWLGCEGCEKNCKKTFNDEEKEIAEQAQGCLKY